MKVTCELTIGNNEDRAGSVVQLEGNPFERSGFVHLIVDGVVYELVPAEVMEAISRVRSDNVR